MGGACEQMISTIRKVLRGFMASQRMNDENCQARPQGGAFGAKPPQNFCLPPQNFSGLKFQWLMI